MTLALLSWLANLASLGQAAAATSHAPCPAWFMLIVSLVCYLCLFCCTVDAVQTVPPEAKGLLGHRSPREVYQRMERIWFDHALVPCFTQLDKCDDYMRLTAMVAGNAAW